MLWLDVDVTGSILMKAFKFQAWGGRSAIPTGLAQEL